MAQVRSASAPACRACSHERYTAVLQVLRLRPQTSLVCFCREQDVPRVLASWGGLLQACTFLPACVRARTLSHLLQSSSLRRGAAWRQAAPRWVLVACSSSLSFPSLGLAALRTTGSQSVRTATSSHMRLHVADACGASLAHRARPQVLCLGGGACTEEEVRRLAEVGRECIRVDVFPAARTGSSARPPPLPPRTRASDQAAAWRTESNGERMHTRARTRVRQGQRETCSLEVVPAVAGSRGAAVVVHHLRG